MDFIKNLFAGRSGKPCLTKVITYQWISFLIVIIGFCVWKTGGWPTGIPSEVYWTIPTVLGVKTYGDIKLTRQDVRTTDPVQVAPVAAPAVSPFTPVVMPATIPVPVSAAPPLPPSF